MKFGFNRPSGFRDIWKCWHTYIRTTEPSYTISLSMSLKASGVGVPVPNRALKRKLVILHRRSLSNHQRERGREQTSKYFSEDQTDNNRSYSLDSWERLVAAKHTKYLLYPDEEARLVKLWMRSLISLRTSLSWHSWLCGFCFDLSHVMFFCFVFYYYYYYYYIDDFAAKSTLLHLYRAVSLESMRRNGKSVKFKASAS